MKEMKSDPRQGPDVRQLHVANGPLNVLRDRTQILDENEHVASALQRRALNLIDTHVTERGVDYDALRYSEAFASFVRTAALLAELNYEQVHQLHDADFINLYNAMVLHGSVVLRHPRNASERQAFYSHKVCYAFGPYVLSLDDIEHGVLRRSRDGKGFGLEDNRRVLFTTSSSFDPRIHFALNCGAKSCPPIKLFTKQNLNNELKAASHAFLDSETCIKENNTIVLSRLFFWYALDFLTLSEIGDSLDPITEQAQSSNFWSDEFAVAAKYGRHLIFAASRLASPTLSNELNDIISSSSSLDLIFAPYDWSRNDNDEV
mmetsp:Transcript_22031/g.27396  ORF Transcript_22031/g.27396 Transcript_22031/m.27396 type:complete len:318 (+) Transcript_22031:451-1404(+)